MLCWSKKAAIHQALQKYRFYKKHDYSVFNKIIMKKVIMKNK